MKGMEFKDLKEGDLVAIKSYSGQWAVKTIAYEGIEDEAQVIGIENGGVILLFIESYFQKVVFLERPE